MILMYLYVPKRMAVCNFYKLYMCMVHACMHVLFFYALVVSLISTSLMLMVGLHCIGLLTIRNSPELKFFWMIMMQVSNPAQSGGKFFESWLITHEKFYPAFLMPTHKKVYPCKQKNFTHVNLQTLFYLQNNGLRCINLCKFTWEIFGKLNYSSKFSSMWLYLYGISIVCVYWSRLNSLQLCRSLPS